MKVFFKLLEIGICEIIGFIKGIVTMVLLVASILGIAVAYYKPKTMAKLVKSLAYAEKKGDDIK